MTHNKLKKIALSKSKVKAEYDALEPEFTLLREMLLVRQKAGLNVAVTGVPCPSEYPPTFRQQCH